MKRAYLALYGALSLLSTTALAAAPDTEAVEFYNVDNRHFFITATASDVSIIDRGGAGPGWMRTGRTFQAWLDKAAAPPEAQPVCRFYSRMANSHFYTASGGECRELQALESAERAATGEVRGWQFEGVAFYIQVPASGQCPAGTTQLSRMYNNGYATGEGANHRYVDDAALKELMEERSWIPEGVAFCAPAKATGTNANLPATTTSFDSLVGTWSGTAEWEKESNGVETESRAALELAIAADGAVSGSGNGCTFTGRVTLGDGFRSLFTGTVTAAGCADPAFNGDYSRFRLERFDGGTMLAKLKKGDRDPEESISARLTNAGAANPPPAGGAPVAEAIAGDWIGTVAWQAEATGQPEVEVNRPLSLSIAAGGAVTGSGFGCTFSGSLAPIAGDHPAMSGVITAAGCENPVFNGDFAQARVRRDDRGLKVELERESAGSEVGIKGTLQAKDAGTTPAPAPVAAIVGDWEGDLSWFASERSAARETVLVEGATQSVRLTIATGGAVTGSGYGCSFSGTLTLSPTGRSAISGEITASGCTKEIFNGTYTEPGFGLDDGKLQVELEREVRTATGTVKVKIAGKVAKA